MFNMILHLFTLKVAEQVYYEGDALPRLPDSDEPPFYIRPNFTASLSL